MSDPRVLRHLFDSVAESYDRARPNYPSHLYDYLADQLPTGHEVLEVGAGTGKATADLVARGVNVSVVEPGAAMARVLARKLPDVDVHESTFEDWPASGESFDALLSFQAWHWVDPTIGFPKAAGHLNAGGFIGLVWNTQPVDFPFGLASRAIYDELFPDSMNSTRSRSTTPAAVAGRRVSEIDASGCFEPVQVSEFPWGETYTTTEYLDLIQTYSDHIALEKHTREQLIERLGSLIDAELGGTFVKPYVTILLQARPR